MPLVAVAQQVGVSGADLIRGLATAYEIQIDLVKGICLHEHKIDHVAPCAGGSMVPVAQGSAPRPRRWQSTKPPWAEWTPLGSLNPLCHSKFEGVSPAS